MPSSFERRAQNPPIGFFRTSFKVEHLQSADETKTRPNGVYDDAHRTAHAVKQKETIIDETGKDEPQQPPSDRLGISGEELDEGDVRHRSTGNDQSDEVVFTCDDQIRSAAIQLTLD
jgi:hypothetical protein